MLEKLTCRRLFLSSPSFLPARTSLAFLLLPLSPLDQSSLELFLTLLNIKYEINPTSDTISHAYSTIQQLPTRISFQWDFVIWLRSNHQHSRGHNKGYVNSVLELITTGTDAAGTRTGADDRCVNKPAMGADRRCQQTLSGSCSSTPLKLGL